MHRTSFIVAATALVAPVLAASAAPALAASPRVDVLVVDRSDRGIEEREDVALRAGTTRVGSRRCAVAAGTPLAGLLALRLRLAVTDAGGACGSRPADSTGLYVRGVEGQTARGRQGWVYKVDGRAGTTGAADPSGPRGTGRRIRDGASLLWFWCRLQSDGGCQRTLELRGDTRTGVGGTIRVRVRALDDQGRSRAQAAAGATLSSSHGPRARIARDGTASIPAPDTASTTSLVVRKAGLVRSSNLRVVVG